MQAYDRKDRSYYDNFTDEDRKKFSTYLMLKYGANVSGNKDLQAYYLMATNERVNKNFIELGSKHTKLQWLTLVACSHESKAKQFHEWIPLKKEKNKKEEFLATIFPTMKRADIATLAVITTDREIKDYCQNLGWDKKEVNAIKF